MKTKITKFALALFVATTLGCEEQKITENEKNADPKIQALQEETAMKGAASYFPSKTMVKQYTGGFENGGETHRVLQADGKHVHVLVNNGGTSLLFIYEVSADQVKQVYSSGEEYESTEVLKEFVPNRNEVVLATPLEVGKRWQDADGTFNEITAIDHKIETPAGTFETIEVTHHDKEFPTKSYYAKGIGLVHTAVPEMHGILLKEIK